MPPLAKKWLLRCDTSGSFNLSLPHCRFLRNIALKNDTPDNKVNGMCELSMI
jgi:hypothetical protein